MLAQTTQAYLSDTQIVTEIQWGSLPDPYNLLGSIAVELIEGQFPQLHEGIKYEGPEQIIRIDTPPGVGDGRITYRGVVPILGGELPVIVAPETAATPGEPFSGGVWWERASLATGWWNQDWPGVTRQDGPEDIPPGPEFGQLPRPLDLALADVALALGLPDWFEF